MADAQELLSPGRSAPDFQLPISEQDSLRLSDLRGGPVVLAFYPGDFSPVCGEQMTLYAAMRPEIEQDRARLLGISVDSVWSHLAFADIRGIDFPLLADFEPKGEVAKAYGAYDEGAGVAERALFVLDPQGKVFWSYLSPMGVNPGADGIINALDRLEQSGTTRTG